MNYIGISDEEFIRSNVPMTKQEIRILSLVKAQIAPNATVYDIGAGTGSFAIEAARLAPDGHIYAIERNSEAVGLVKANAANFQVRNITVIHSEAPEGLAELPPADTVFIGGSGHKLDEILATITPKLVKGGKIVLNSITLQTIMAAINYFREHKTMYSYETISVQVSRLEQVGDYDMAKAENPIYILTAVKLG